MEVIRTDKGSLALPSDVSVSLVLFVDAYHRLWKPLPLLEQLKERMSQSALVAVVERQGLEGGPRHLAGHRRRLSSSLVIDDMCQAGFQLRQTLRPPARDRYFLLFDLQSLPMHRAAESHRTSTP